MDENQLTQQEKIQRGAQDAGRYFRCMADFVGFTEEDAQAIRESSLVIEKHLPSIVADFYTHLLRYGPTRQHFIRADGTVDQDYLQKRMLHLTNFWRRTAGGVYDDEYARYIDYVGRAHTSHGADPNIYIAERYVIGQVGFIQHAVANALHAELHDFNPELEERASRGWNLLLMVILEMLARAYDEEHEYDFTGGLLEINREPMHALAVATYEQGLGLTLPPVYREVPVAKASEIAEGERKLVQVGAVSIGIFHHKGGWYAVRNHCLHRGGPVAAGKLEGDVLTCPWHGFQYDVTDGHLLVDPPSKLETYPVVLQGDEVTIRFAEPPEEVKMGQLFDPAALQAAMADQGTGQAPDEAPAALQPNEFYARDIPPGKMGLVQVVGQPVVVYNAAGEFYATSQLCTHEGGPLDEGDLDGTTVTCPWHGSCFNVKDGAVVCGPAEEPVAVYRVSVRDGIGRVDV